VQLANNRPTSNVIVYMVRGSITAAHASTKMEHNINQQQDISQHYW
jgi:hypothetical protein